MSSARQASQVVAWSRLCAECDVDGGIIKAECMLVPRLAMMDDDLQPVAHNGQPDGQEKKGKDQGHRHKAFARQQWLCDVCLSNRSCSHTAANAWARVVSDGGGAKVKRERASQPASARPCASARRWPCAGILRVPGVWCLNRSESKAAGPALDRLPLLVHLFLCSAGARDAVRRLCFFLRHCPLS
jgi:hypothetical protein